MLRILLIAAVLVGVLFVVANAHAQDTTGTISGRIYYTNQPQATCVQANILIIPYEAVQPLAFSDALAQYGVDHGCDGDFSVEGVAAGDYLVAVDMNPDLLPSDYDNEVRLLMSNTAFAFPAKRVTLHAGAQVVVDIPLTVPDEWLTPVPTPACATGATSSISGLVTLIGPPPYGGYLTQLAWVPTYVPQPIHFNPAANLHNQITADPSGQYHMPCLIAGEYFVILSEDARMVAPIPEYVRFISSSDGVTSFPALRVRVDEGQSATGIDFIITFSTPEPINDLTPTATPTPSIGFPDVGSGSQRASNGLATAMIGALLSSVALLAGCLAVRYRQTRQ
jgi:hypothetical protein